MHRSYRVAIADDNRADLFLLRECLSRSGHDVAFEAHSGEELVQQCASDSPELIITDIYMGEMDGLTAASEILAHQEIPVIIVSGADIAYFLDHSDTCRPMAYLTKPFCEGELRAAIVVAMQRFEELQSYRAEASSMRQALEDRKVIERAKGLLMRQRSLDEPNAFQYLQQLARRHRQKLVDVSNSLIMAEHALCNRTGSTSAD
jgi:two-component system, response regulator PdtaR